jgi:hypothetical protein
VHRYGIWFFPPAGAKVTVLNDTPVVLGQGINLQQSQAPVWLCIDDHGDCVQKPWFGIYSVQGDALGIIEVMK